MKKHIKAAISGALGGSLSGFFGTGGGMVLVPLFRDWVKLDDKKSMATSVMCVAPLCALSSFLYYTQGSLPLTDAFPYALGGFIGGICAGLFMKTVPPYWLRRAFGALLVFGGLKMLLF